MRITGTSLSLQRAPFSLARALGSGLLAAAALAGTTAATPAAAQTDPYALTEAQKTTATALRDSALKGTKGMDILTSLTNEVGPRPAGSAGDKAAVAWAVAKLKELGFANVHSEKVTVPHWVRGAESGEILAPYPQRVVLTALGGSVATPAAGVEAAVVEVDSLEALAATEPAKVKGKIVFFNTPTQRTRDGQGYGKAVRVRGGGASAAARLGAVAVVIRSIGTDNDRLPHTGAMRYEDGVAKIPAAALSNPDADLLASQVASGKAVRFRLKLETQSHPEAESANVIGEIRGHGKPEEIVLIGAHLDSWDLGLGAIDDGAGVAIVTEAARRIGQLPEAERPQRTIRIVLFANEEFGLSGARAYAAAHAAELPHHVVALESDLGANRVWRLGSHVANEALPAVSEILRLLYRLDITSGNNLADGGADLHPLTAAGVPVLALDQDATVYFNWHHSANDTPDKISALDLNQNVAAWVATVYAAAQMPGGFGRAPAPEAEEA